MKLEELKAIRRFLKKEMKWQEEMFEMSMSWLEDNFYDWYNSVDWKNNIKTINKSRERWHFLNSLLESVEEEIEKKKRSGDKS